MTSPADVRHLHFRSRRCLGANVGVAIVARAPVRADSGGDRFVASAAAEEGAQVVAGAGEEAEIELAIGGETGARTTAAERLGDRGDDADLAAAVDVAPAFGDFAEVVRVERLDRPVLM